MRRSSVILALSVAAVTLGSDAAAQTGAPEPAHAAPLRAPTGRRILGVFDAESGLPLADVEVVDLFTDESYRTEAAGLVGLWAFHSRHDSVAVRIRKIGYSDTAFVVLVAAADTAPVPIFLRKTVALPALITEAIGNRAVSRNMQEFESRRKEGFGHFLTTDDLRKRDATPISDLIHDLILGRQRQCKGPPRIFLDGTPAGTLPDTAGRTGSNYEAVEFYSVANTPLQFNSTSSRGGCGVVLLWSRERL